MKYTIQPSDLIQDLEGFPIEIVQKMVDYQFEQNGFTDIEVFQRSALTGMSGNGFTWSETTELGDFWEDVIKRRKFDLFFEKYPKEKPFPRVMWMWDCDSKIKKKRVVFAHIKNKWIAWDAAKTIEKAEDVIYSIPWDFTSEIEETPIKLTLQDISDGKGVGVPPHLIKIIS